MTGHQPNPGVDMKALNLEGYHRVSIENIVKAIGISHVGVIRPFNIKKSINTIKEAHGFQGCLGRYLEGVVRVICKKP
jgi:indolepyruvate ferredoxin oxidoreductase alpha subunit